MPLIRSAMNKMTETEGWYPLSQIGKHIRSDMQDFDPRTYGKPKLSDLVTCLPQFQVRKNDVGIQIRPLH